MTRDQKRKVGREKRIRDGGGGGEHSSSDESDAGDSGKGRVIWTDEMKEAFRLAVGMLGPSASPKMIMEAMKDYPELGRQHISSHLQKHRMYNKRLENLKVKPAAVAKSKAGAAQGARRGVAGGSSRGSKTVADGTPTPAASTSGVSGARGQGAGPLSTPGVAAAGLGTVAQIIDVTNILTDAQFVESNDVTGPNATIGKHLRHVIVHYKALIASLRSSGAKHGAPSVSYDDPSHRGRGGTCESDRSVCIAESSGIQKWFKSIKEADLEKPLEARFMISSDGRESAFTSTVGRELMFVNHHAVHHLASVAVICRDMGLDLPNGFGMAPSTLSSGIGINSSA